MTIAGSDSGAGAGIQADIKTCAALGVYCTSVLTAITAQNTRRITALESLPTKIVAQQFEAVIEDFNVAAIKVGMIGSAENLHYLAARLLDYKRTNPRVYIVLDTPLRASVGFSLFDDENLAPLWKMIGVADLITPNLSEAGRLLGCQDARSNANMELQALELIKRGARAVLIKGGHLIGAEASDYYLSVDAAIKPMWFSSGKLAAKNNHGTGCTLASAIAAHIVLGYSAPEAIASSKRYLYLLLQQSQHRQYGLGAGPLECLNQSRFTD
ncbi:bifunctional hydroxymethylpyrimidine kinase/phosphomethylpyrimidine kinase [Simiduia curdlanivorans]|nr:bifunctional hydroxymethylpyrimidine kinase/phosphomethylpyrimidine kinase [Simiduia curdlanivorans]MDN3638156.1 bifunctional hydroxymethylpyrimidine kinase/phosphomethylpyrimidine kinase [Simiduia curdlanivorans]